MNPRQRFLQVIYALHLVVALGVIGYMTIEGWSFLDALYMTVITLSTVGYSEVYDLSAAGRVSSIVLIIGGVGVMLYTLTYLVRYFSEGRFTNILGRHRMKEKISKLKRHIILYGNSLGGKK